MTNSAYQATSTLSLAEQHATHRRHMKLSFVADSDYTFRKFETNIGHWHIFLDSPRASHIADTHRNKVLASQPSPVLSGRFPACTPYELTARSSRFLVASACRNHVSPPRPREFEPKHLPNPCSIWATRTSSILYFVSTASASYNDESAFFVRSSSAKHMTT